MTDHRAILKRAGIVLIAFGLADIAFMIYSVARGQSYSSSFNIFAVIAGVFLMRGSLGTARLVTQFSAFMLTGFLGAVFFVLPFLQPVGLLVTQVRLDPVWSITLWGMALAALVLLGWTYRQLRSAPVLEALRASGRPASTPKLAIGLGIALVVVLAVVMNMTPQGAEGAKATSLAQQQLGPSYQYAPQSIHWGGGHHSAVVAAYNDYEVRYIAVEWSD